jgi:iron complex transport system permease protein
MILVFACLIGMAVSLSWGSVPLSPSKIARLLLGTGSDTVESDIFWKLRLPRVLMGVFVGGGLAVCGAVFQSLLRNPLAEPFTLGISGGGALGAAAAVLLGVPGWGMVPFSLGGCLLSILIVYAVASRKKFSDTALILGGVVLNFLFSSLVLLAMGLARSSQIRSAMIWLMGDVSSAPPGALVPLSLLVSLSAFLLFLFSRELDLLTLGEEKARYLGLDARKFRKALFVLVSAVVGACVSVSGVVGFVGLMMPHFARKLTGPAHRGVVPAAFLSGACFFVLCDALARNAVRPAEIPVGVVTGVIGGMFFLALLLKSKHWDVMR